MWMWQKLTFLKDLKQIVAVLESTFNSYIIGFCGPAYNEPLSAAASGYFMHLNDESIYMDCG